MAASRLLLADTRALAEQWRALLPPAMDDRNAALVELNLITAAGAAEVAQRFLERFASVFGDGPAGGPPPLQQTSGYFRCWLTPPESKELLTADAAPGRPVPVSGAHSDIQHPEVVWQRSLRPAWVEWAARLHTLSQACKTLRSTDWRTRDRFNRRSRRARG